jgi:hypothetical protein
MGMRGYYVELDSDDMSAVLNNRKAALEMLMGSVTGGASVQDLLKGLGVKDIEGSMAQMAKLLGPMDAGKSSSSATAAKKSRPRMEVEKSWHGLHYVLNGDPWKGSGALSHVVMGGTEVGEDAGYGRPHYVNPFQVVQASTALDRITDAEFEQRVRKTDFSGKDIYCYDDKLHSEDIAELVHYFKEVRKFFHDAAERSNGVLVGIL